MRNEPLTLEQQLLAERFLPLAQRIARIHARERPEADEVEIESAAMLGLVLGVRTYDPAKNDNPSKWITFKIKGCLIDRVHRQGAWGDIRKHRGMQMPSVGGMPEFDIAEEYFRDCVTGDIASRTIDDAMSAHTLYSAAEAIGCDRRELLRLIVACKPLPVGVGVMKVENSEQRVWVIEDEGLDALRELVRASRRRQYEVAKRRLEAVGVEVDDV